ncbi:MAG: filamentous hemagglutinin N-terminal domain-containing protein [Pelosinus sp.]|nr:filamentous hemagglutinin N-terminal domain-containing protein [Pelosinus sp.]
MEKYKKLLASLLTLLFLAQPLIGAAMTKADPNAGKNRPKVTTADSGATVVQIAKPSGDGVSLNLYKQFEVNKYGLVLNNSASKVESVLAGKIAGNSNLSQGTARIIINQVTGTKQSKLKGYIEVAGQKADVIIANPNGIIGNGFGFINTGRATLTTGQVQNGGSASLSGFNVTQGIINIGKGGLDASGADRVDIISRAVFLNDAIWAKEINIVGGANNVSYDTLQPMAISGQSATPKVLLDVGKLGGMYADKICLVGTEKGVGVNIAGSIVATDLKIDNTGNVNVKDKGFLYAREKMSIATKDELKNSGVISSGKDTTLSGNSVVSTGIINAGVTEESKLGTSGDLTISSQKDVALNGTVAAGNIKIDAKGDVTNSDLLYGQGNVAINTTGSIQNASKISSGQNLTLAANNITSSGEINAGENQDSTFSSAGDLSITSQGSVTLSGDTVAAGNIGITAQSDVKNEKLVYAKGNIDIAAQGAVQNNGGINSEKNITLAGSAVNSANALDSGIASDGTWTSGDLTIKSIGTVTMSGDTTSAGNVNITAGSDFTNSGKLYGQNGANIDTQGILKNTNNIYSGQNTVLTAKRIDLSGTFSAGVNKEGNIVTAGNLNLNSNGAVNLVGDTFAAGDINVIAADTVVNQGALYAQGNVVVTTHGAINNSVSMKAGKDMALTGQSIVSSGKINAGTTADGILGTSGDLTLQSTGTVTLVGDTLAAGNAKISTGDSFVNNGSFYSQGNTVIESQGTLKNTNAIAAGQTISLSAQNLDSTGTITAGETKDGTTTMMGDLTINSGSTVSLSGDTIAAGDIKITSAGDVVNNALLYSQGTVGVDTKGTLQNTATIGGGGSVTLSSQAVNSNGTIAAGADKQGNINGNGNLSITSIGNAILAGSTAVSDDLTINAADVNLLGGQINVGKFAEIIASQGDVNNDNGSITASNGIRIKALNGSISNNKGLMINKAANKFLLLNAGDAITNIGGAISSEGTLFLRGSKVDNQGEVISKGATSIFVVKSLHNSGLIDSGSSLLINTAGSTINDNDGKIISVDWLEITGDGSINNEKGHIVSAKEVSLWDPHLTSTVGLGGPRIMINGKDKLYNASIPVIDYFSGFSYDYHFYIDSASNVTGAYAASLLTAVNSGLYALEGNPRAAFQEFALIPASFVKMKGPAKAFLGFAKTEKVVVNETKYKLNTIDLQLFAQKTEKIIPPINPKKVSNRYLEENGIDPHNLKYDVLGKRAEISRYNIFVDKNGTLWLQKNGSREWVPTYESI